MLNNKKKKITLILPSLHAGGMERVMSELAICFVEQKNAEVDIILLGIDEQFYNLPKEIKIHEPGFTFNKEKRLFGTLKTMLFLRNKLKKLKPDVVLSFGEMYNSFVLIATIFTRHKVFISDRSKPDKNWGTVHHLLRFFSYHRASGIIAQTEYAKQMMFKRLINPNVEVIGNPIKQMPATTALKNRDKIILTVGRLIKSKRLDLLIKIFHQTDYKNWRLIIVGDGPEKQYLQNLATTMNLTNNIEFTGNQKDVSAYYKQAKIFAFTSNSEGFPNALGEAMSEGLAAITFDFIAGASDLIINETNGLLIPMDDETKYVNQLNKLMQDEELIENLGIAAKQYISRYDRNIIADKYYSFLLS